MNPMNYEEYYTKYCLTQKQIPLLEKVFNCKKDKIAEELDKLKYEEVVTKLAMINLILKAGKYA